MTVQEMINKLSQYPLDSEVILIHSWFGTTIWDNIQLSPGQDDGKTIAIITSESRSPLDNISESKKE